MIVVEVTDSYELGYILRGLDELKAALAKPRKMPPAKATPKPGQKKLERQAMLMLPPPRALGPYDRSDGE